MWAYAAFVGYALEHGRPLRVLYFGAYYDLFADPNVLPGVHFHRRLEATHYAVDRLYYAVRKLPAAWHHRLGVTTLDAGATNLSALEASGAPPLALVRSWLAPVPASYLQLHHAEIRRVFRPRQDIQDRVANFIAELRASADVLIGVHMRRGDYREYLGGRFYYDDTEYLRFMRQARELFPDQRATFIVCSNEPVNPEAFPGVEWASLPKANGMEDLHVLAACDYLIGPPSTYSMWASYYGRKPLCFLTARTASLGRNDFDVIVSQDTFASGKRLTV